MKPGPILLVGGGGHALVVAESARLAGLDIAGFVDDAPDAVLGRAWTRLGPLSAWRGHPARPFLALGGLPIRRRMIDSGPADFATVIHPSAIVSPEARIGAGAFIGPGAVVNPRASIGAHAIINTAAVVEHDCAVGENAHIAPGAVLGGAAGIGPDTLVGLGARVLPGVKVGAGCTVGAGAVVVRDVPDGETVAGVPARAVERAR